MINSTSYENIITTLGNKIINILKLPRDYLFNSISLHGSDLLKRLTNNTYESFTTKDTFIVFTLEENSEDYYVLEEDDDSISSLSSFKFILHIYGDDCHICSQKLLVAFKEENILCDLHENGLYISEVKYPTFKYEPINNTIWQRCDIDINLRVRFNFPKISDEKIFSSSNDIKIERL